MSIGEGRWSVFVERPVSFVLLSIVLAVLIVPRVLAWRRRHAPAPEARVA
jgi:putative tricarboxylic transport membrane protein